jgi:hypothetical protein
MTQEDIILESELQAMANANPNLVVHLVSYRPGLLEA